jgi:hypothetical protein
MAVLFPFANVGRISPIITHCADYVELFMRTYIEKVAKRVQDDAVILSSLINGIDKMLEKAIETTRYKQYTAVQFARFADDLVVLVDSHARHSWIVPALKKRMRAEFGER